MAGAHTAATDGGSGAPAGATLPSYTLRRSARVHHARLVLSVRDGLVVVVPTRFDAARVPELVAAKAGWIERSARRLGTTPTPPPPPVLPSRVELGALGRSFAVHQRPTAAARCRVETAGGVLLLHRGQGAPDETALGALRAWLSREARAALVPWLLELAAAQGLTVNRVSIRAQRTRWGSCSARGDVSLNRALLFLPPELVGHVLLHELTHRVELNHSTRFRVRLAAMDPEADVHADALRGAWRHVPRWAC